MARSTATSKQTEQNRYGWSGPLVTDSVAPPSIIVRPHPTNVGATTSLERAKIIVGTITLFCGSCLLLAMALGSLVIAGKLVVVVLSVGFFLVLAPVVNYFGVKNATVFVNGNSFGMTTITGKRRMFATSDLAGVVLCTIVVPGRRASRTACAFFVSTSGECLFQLKSRQWGRDDLERICNACGVPLVGSWDEVCWSGFSPKLAALLPKVQR